MTAVDLCFRVPTYHNKELTYLLQQNDVKMASLDQTSGHVLWWSQV